MQNFMKTILSAVQAWTKGKIKDSAADWNQNDSSADNYVKNRTHWEEENTTVFADNVKLTFVSGDSNVSWIDTPFSLNIVEGQTYTVIWDGIEYVLEAYDDDGIILGNHYIWCNNSYSEENANPPFVINSSWIGIYNPSAEETHTVSISTSQTVVHTIDPKYLDLPDNIATTDDVQEAVDLAQSTADSKMDKTNPVGTGSFSMNSRGSLGRYSHTEGYNCSASNVTTIEPTSTSMSNSSGQYGYGAHAEGYGTVASGVASHSEGTGTLASGRFSHAEGDSTTASGDISHAEGYSTTASGAVSHAEGMGTFASGQASHAEGRETTASGQASHAEGCYTEATNQAQHVQGKYNILDTEGTATTKGKYAHIVGNGTSDTARSNAHTLDWNGVGWFQGGLQVGGNAQDDGAKNVLLEGEAYDYFVLNDVNTGTPYKIQIIDGNLVSSVMITETETTEEAESTT